MIDNCIWCGVKYSAKGKISGVCPKCAGMSKYQTEDRDITLLKDRSYIVDGYRYNYDTICKALSLLPNKDERC